MINFFYEIARPKKILDQDILVFHNEEDKKMYVQVFSRILL